MSNYFVPDTLPSNWERNKAESWVHLLLWGSRLKAFLSGGPCFSFTITLSTVDVWKLKLRSGRQEKEDRQYFYCFEEANPGQSCTWWPWWKGRWAVTLRRKEPTLEANQPEQSPRHCSHAEVPHSISGATSVIFQAKVTISGLEHAAFLGLAM